MLKLRQFFGKINIGSPVLYDERMALHTTLKLGGPADAWTTPASLDDLIALVRAAEKEGIPFLVVGGGANLLVGDRGIRGIVVGTEALRSVRQDSNRLVLSAGLSMDEACLEALARGLSGLENFAGMPGSVGGSVFMNARCYETEMADRLAWVEVITAEGKLKRRPHRPDEWSYKRSPFQTTGPDQGSLILSAAFDLEPGEAPRIAATMRARRADREKKGHYRLPSAGSTFKNDRAFGRPTGAILDSLGFRGVRIGSAAVSDWHANIFVNIGEPECHAPAADRPAAPGCCAHTAADMRALIELARTTALEKLGIMLEPEVVMVGEF